MTPRYCNKLLYTLKSYFEIQWKCIRRIIIINLGLFMPILLKFLWRDLLQHNFLYTYLCNRVWSYHIRHVRQYFKIPYRHYRIPGISCGLFVCRYFYLYTYKAMENLRNYFRKRERKREKKRALLFTLNYLFIFIIYI